MRQTVRTHPEMLCWQVGVSRSNLYRLLEIEGGVTAYIQRRRLTKARNRLSDSRNGQSIASMAHVLCFADSSLGVSRLVRRQPGRGMGCFGATGGGAFRARGSCGAAFADLGDLLRRR